jgi:hypothetical protein
MKLIRWKELALPFALSMTLGLAPFFPEPHIVGKLAWLFGGGNGMEPMDYFDLCLHSFPWIFLIYRFIYVFKKSK